MSGQKLNNKEYRINWIFPAMICILIGLTGWAYHSTLSKDSILLNWDDQVYITNNPLIQSPLSFRSVAAMFTKPITGTYCGIPQLTWWFDYHFYGIEKVSTVGTPANAAPQYYAYGFHLTNVIFHTANTILVFLIIIMLCRRLKYAAMSCLFIAFITAFLFGIHPQRVESVAWVTERKDLTYAFFFLLAIYTYLGKSKWRIELTGLLFILSLLSKGQAVTLVPTLLLIDYLLGISIDRKVYFSFMAIALLAGLMALSAQQKAITYFGGTGGYFRHILLVPYYAIWGYVGRFVMPADFSAFYIYPSSSPTIYIYPILSIAVVILLWYCRNDKILVFGVLFFLVNIIFLLQFIPRGNPVMADRYNYIPSIGLAFIVAVWVYKALKVSRLPTIGICILTASLLITTTIARSEVWETDTTLWYDAIKQNPDNYEAFEMLAIYYEGWGLQTDSLNLYTRKAIAARSTNPMIYNFQIDYYLKNNFIDSALSICDMLFASGWVREQRDSAFLFQNRGITYNRLHRDPEAIADLQKNLQYPLTKPQALRSLKFLGNSYAKLNQLDSAITIYTRSYDLEPHSYIQFDIATFYLIKADTAVAQQHFKIGLGCSDIVAINKEAIRRFAHQLALPDSIP